MLRIYTQDNCKYCDELKKNLDDWAIEYSIVNITHNDVGKQFLKKKGLKTVPQLFDDDIHINEGMNTSEITREIIESAIKK